MRSSPSPSDRRAARFVSMWALVLGLGLAGLMAGCGEGGGTTTRPVSPEASKQIEEAKRQSYKGQQKAQPAHKTNPIEAARRKSQ